jgi:hypothetical protein
MATSLKIGLAPLPLSNCHRHLLSDAKAYQRPPAPPNPPRYLLSQLSRYNDTMFSIARASTALTLRCSSTLNCNYLSRQNKLTWGSGIAVQKHRHPRHLHLEAFRPRLHCWRHTCRPGQSERATGAS